MSDTILITLCILVLMAYVFDLTSARTRIPSVILLFFLGWGVRQFTRVLGLPIPDLTPVLAILGTVGLILIVLEGSLELELNRSKAPLIKTSVFMALVPMFLLAVGLAYILQYFGYPDFRNNLANAIPLCVISSAIAIPSVHSFTRHNRDFVIYESSLSDILGILFFNFVALNESFQVNSVTQFIGQLVIITGISFGATVGLAYLLSRIDHHIKFVPIILLIILIFGISKVFHLPGLIFILIFGLFLGNLDEIKHVNWISRLKPDELDKEVHKFKELTIEGAFLIRTVFFLLFGYLIETSELLNTQTLLWAGATVTGIFVVRALALSVLRLPLSPLLYIAPRGLITILLFLSIDPGDTVSVVNKSLVTQVIVLSALVMMFGVMTERSDKQTTQGR